MTPQEILDALNQMQITGFVAQVMTAGALAESEGNPQAIGDNGHSGGLWQMHDQGRGAGLTLEQRMNVFTAASRMYPYYQQGLERAEAQGIQGDEELATFSYMEAERPYGYPDRHSAAATRFRTKWNLIQPMETNSINSNAQAFIQAAKKYEGQPYVFGGLDCSQLIANALRDAGLDPAGSFDTTAEGQYRLCTEVPLDQIQPGDLVFFADPENANPGETISHVGVWLRPGYMYDTHAPRGVGETYLYRPEGNYWQDTWHSVGRIPVIPLGSVPNTGGSQSSGTSTPPTPVPPVVDPNQRRIQDYQALLGYLTGDVVLALLKETQSIRDSLDALEAAIETLKHSREQV